MTTHDPCPDTSSTRLDAIVDACAAIVTDAVDRNDIPGIGRVAEAFGTAEPDSVAPACPDRAHELIEQAAPSALGAASNPTERLAAAVRAGARDLNWWTSYGDHTEPDMVELLRSYFVTSIVSRAEAREAPRRHPGVAVYLTIQGANLMYPQHAHKAPELYYPVAGTGLWQTGDRPFEPKPPGTWVVHPTGTRHAMETLGEPLLAMAIWTADLASIPVIIRD